MDYAKEYDHMVEQSNKQQELLVEQAAQIKVLLEALEFCRDTQSSAILELVERLGAAEQDAARYETLQNMSGLCFSYAVKHQLIGRLNDYVDAIKPQVDKAIAALKESK